MTTSHINVEKGNTYDSRAYFLKSNARLQKSVSDVSQAKEYFQKLGKKQIVQIEA